MFLTSLLTGRLGNNNNRSAAEERAVEVSVCQPLMLAKKVDLK